MKKRMLVLAATTLLAACSWWNAGTQLKSGTLADTQYAAATADLTFVFARPKGDGSPQPGAAPRSSLGATQTPDADANYTVCAAPSPDVAKAISDAIKATGDATAQGLKALGGTGASITLTEGLSGSQNASLTEIGRRLATTQLMRDGVYRLCEGFANGAITREEYGLALSRYGDTMVTLLAIEAVSGLDANQSAGSASSKSKSDDTQDGASAPGAASGASTPIAANPPEGNKPGGAGVASQGALSPGETSGGSRSAGFTRPPIPAAGLERISYPAQLLLPVAAAAPGGGAVHGAAGVAAPPAQHKPPAKGNGGAPGAAQPASATQDTKQANIPAIGASSTADEANAIVTLQSNYLRQSIYAPVIVLCTSALGPAIGANDNVELNKLQLSCKDLLNQYVQLAKEVLAKATAQTPAGN